MASWKLGWNLFLLDGKNKKDQKVTTLTLQSSVPPRRKDYTPRWTMKNKLDRRACCALRNCSETLRNWVRDDEEKGKQAGLLFTRKSVQNPAQVQRLRGDGTSNRDVCSVFPVARVAGNALQHCVSWPETDRQTRGSNKNTTMREKWTADAGTVQKHPAEMWRDEWREMSWVGIESILK